MVVLFELNFRRKWKASWAYESECMYVYVYMCVCGCVCALTARQMSLSVYAAQASLWWQAGDSAVIGLISPRTWGEIWRLPQGSGAYHLPTHTHAHRSGYVSIHTQTSTILLTFAIPLKQTQMHGRHAYTRLLDFITRLIINGLSSHVVCLVTQVCVCAETIYYQGTWVSGNYSLYKSLRGTIIDNSSQHKWQFINHTHTI